MTQANRWSLGLFLVAVIGALAGLEWAAGGLYAGRHEGDALHLVDIVLREARGQWPHLDFFTPIGVLATMPIVLFVKLGFGIGHAFIAAQALVALLLFPAIWHVARSRLPGGWAYLFGGFALVLVLALVHGETERGVSVSMHYNRWAWALAYLAVLTSVLPPLFGSRQALPDGAVIGGAMAALVLIKVTYVVAFFPAVLIALLAHRAYRTIGAALAFGLALLGAVTLWAGGLGFWAAYIGDLLAVIGNPLRPTPGPPLGEMIGAPEFLGAVVVLVLSVIFLRQCGRRVEGLALLLLAPAFLYVQNQNWGNDPQWLGLLGLLLVACRPERPLNNAFGWDLRQAIGIAAVATFAFAAPSAINLAWSPLRHAGVDKAEYVALIPGSGVHEDLQTANVRARRVTVTGAVDGPGAPLDGMIAETERARVTRWNGEDWPDCNIGLGYTGWFEAMAADLRASGLVDGKTIFVADVLQGPWLFGVSEPLPGAAPWSYGGLLGFEAADFLLVPRCTLQAEARQVALAAIDETGAEFTEVRRNAMFVLYEK